MFQHYGILIGIFSTTLVRNLEIRRSSRCNAYNGRDRSIRILPVNHLSDYKERIRSKLPKEIAADIKGLQNRRGLPLQSPRYWL